MPRGPSEHTQSHGSPFARCSFTPSKQIQAVTELASQHPTTAFSNSRGQQDPAYLGNATLNKASRSRDARAFARPTALPAAQPPRAARRHGSAPPVRAPGRAGMPHAALLPHGRLPTALTTARRCLPQSPAQRGLEDSDSDSDIDGRAERCGDARAGGGHAGGPGHAAQRRSARREAVGEAKARRRAPASRRPAPRRLTSPGGGCAGGAGPAPSYLGCGCCGRRLRAPGPPPPAGPADTGPPPARRGAAGGRSRPAPPPAREAPGDERAEPRVRELGAVICFPEAA